MAVTLTVGSNSHEFPENNEDPGWGEAVTAWAEDVTDVLGSVSGVNDKSITSVGILNNQSSPVNVTGLAFSVSAVRSFEAPYIVYRTNGTDVETESGILRGNYNSQSADWNFTYDRVGDAGVEFVITAAGQVQYYSDNITGGTYTGLIKYKASTLDI